MGEVVVKVLSEALTVVKSHSTDFALELERLENLGLCNRICPIESVRNEERNLLAEGVWVCKGR